MMRTSSSHEEGGTRHWSVSTKQFLGEKGFDPVLGARPLRRLIQNEVEDRLSEQLLADHFKAGDVVEVDLNEEGKIMISVPKTAETTSATS